LLGGGPPVLDEISVLLEVGGVKLSLDIVAVGMIGCDGVLIVDGVVVVAVMIGRDDVMIVDGVVLVAVMIGRDDVMIVDGVFEGDDTGVKLLAVLSLSSVNNPSLWTG